MPLVNQYYQSETLLIDFGKKNTRNTISESCQLPSVQTRIKRIINMILLQRIESDIFTRCGTVSYNSTKWINIAK